MRLASPYLTALDNNGDPLANAKLYFYLSGTTTLLDTFDAADLATPNANPVIADSNGRFGDIFLQDEYYKLVLKDANDVTVRTDDPVPGAPEIDGDQFKVSQQSPADMTVQVGAGSLFTLLTKTIVSKAVQDSAAITAPSSNPRNDIVHIDRLTGVIGITTGSEAASPTDPTLADGLVPLARINATVGMTEIASGDLDDIRETANLGTEMRATVDVQSFTSSGTWTKPSGALFVLAEGWGGGGGGGGNGTDPLRDGGGGGGAYVRGWFDASDLGATETVSIGSGGGGGVGNVGGDGQDGGNTTFGSFLTAYGGEGGGDTGGGGGGVLNQGGVGPNGTGGPPDGGSPGAGGTDSAFGGAGGASSGNGADSAWGGGSGGHGDGTSGTGGNSLFGGAGGGGDPSGSGGTSVYGGNGGAGGGNGTQPGGGGGGNDSTPGNGAAGQLIVTTWM